MHDAYRLIQYISANITVLSTTHIGSQARATYHKYVAPCKSKSRWCSWRHRIHLYCCQRDGKKEKEVLYTAGCTTGSEVVKVDPHYLLINTIVPKKKNQNNTEMFALWKDALSYWQRGRSSRTVNGFNKQYRNSYHISARIYFRRKAICPVTLFAL